MKRALIVLIITVSPVAAAYSGTFYDGFDDGNLDGWKVEGHARLENGYLVMDGMAAKDHVWVTLQAGDAQNWISYTLRCKVRFSSELRSTPSFFVSVRMGKGNFNLLARQTMEINPNSQVVRVHTAPPHAKHQVDFNILIFDRGGIHGDQLRRPIELDRWYSIKIAAMQNRFEFINDDNVVSEYVDDTTVPGTVEFLAHGRMVAHIDDVTVTGPRIPDINAPTSRLQRFLAVTWGGIKDSTH